MLLRGQISSALVVRGDDYDVRGQMQDATRMYKRAIAFDSSNEIAVDRLCFKEAITHRPALVTDAIENATRYLQWHPRSVSIRADRALANEIAKRYSDAERDFEAAAQDDHQARTYTFAGFAALRAGHRNHAAALFSRAEAIDPAFVPALHGAERAS